MSLMDQFVELLLAARVAAPDRTPVSTAVTMAAFGMALAAEAGINLEDLIAQLRSIYECSDNLVRETARLSVEEADRDHAPPIDRTIGLFNSSGFLRIPRGGFKA